MAFGSFSYGSVSFGGDVTPAITCGPPRCNLIVMEQLLELGYTYEDALRLINLITK